METSSATARIRVGQHELLVDGTNDIYGLEWWSRVSSGKWENSTLGFIEFGTFPGSTFIDLGAASGLLSLIAAKRGARVFAVEPHPLWLKTLQRERLEVCFKISGSCHSRATGIPRRSRANEKPQNSGPINH